MNVYDVRCYKFEGRKKPMYALNNSSTLIICLLYCFAFLVEWSLGRAVAPQPRFIIMAFFGKDSGCYSNIHNP